MATDQSLSAASNSGSDLCRVERVARGWVKRADPAGKNRWGALLRIATLLLPWPMLRVTAGNGDAESVREEAERLQRWRAAGLPVPEVLEATDAYLVTADAGVPLRRWLRDQTDPVRRLEAVKKAARALGQLHRLGLCHGRPFLKDIVYDGESVSFIDLEEDPARVMLVLTAQVRDVMLFVMSYTASLSEAHSLEDLRAIAAVYREENPSPRLQRSLRRNLRALWWAALPLRLCPWGWLGRDGRQAVLGLRVLRRLAR
ncbi:MAG TPA: lipopolysaccharide kinase InaA family protein [Opitutaceae bacterium]|nr:lipopolysaccharide kinase InaA family protein [Opitutaceae bacterium]